MCLVCFSYCNLTHSKSTVTTSDVINEKLPQLFQSHILCAGITTGKKGSCTGDSGGPLMYQDLERNQQWIQIAIVQGAVRDCGDVDFPGLYIRLDESTIFDFIQSAINPSLVAETTSAKLRTEATTKGNSFNTVENLF